jgi:hypothetical protein
VSRAHIIPIFILAEAAAAAAAAATFFKGKAVVAMFMFWRSDKF